MKKTHYHRAGFLVTLLSTFGMRALAEDDGSREQLALALGMSREVLNTFVKPLLGMAGDSIMKLSEDARSAVDHELNSHLEGAIRTAYKDALYDIEQEIVQELNLKEGRTELWRRLLLNEAVEKRETYEQLMLDFFFPLRKALSDDTAIRVMLEEHSQLQPDEYIRHIISTKLPAYADKEQFVVDIAARFRRHYPHHFLQQLKRDDKAKTVYFTISIEALLHSGIEQKEMLHSVLAELNGVIPGSLSGIKELIADRTAAIDAGLAQLQQQIAAKAEPDLIDTDRHNKRNRPGNEGNLFNYKYRYTTFTGRNSEMSELQSFLEHEEKYCWWMIIGPGGMGKSRLALETIKVAIQKGWNAGFLDVKDDFDWTHWNPGMDTLMVIDYAFASTDATAALLEKVGTRAARYGNKLRILLLERSITPEWKNVQTKPAIRDYTYRHPEANTLELPPPDSLWLIIADVIAQSALDADDKYALLHREAEIMHDLEQIDPLRRPLFAFFAAKALVYSEGKNIRGWNVDRLLEFHLQRLETEYWSKSETYRNNALAFKKLLLIATLCRQLPADEMIALEKELNLPPDSKSVYALLADDEGNKNNERGYYTGLQPDILAGYFIAKTFNSLVDGSLSGCNEEDADSLFLRAWNVNSFGCAHTIYLLWQDFLAGRDVLTVYDFLDFLEKNVMNQSEAQVAHFALLLSAIGTVHYERNEHEASLGYYERAIRLQPEYAEAYYNRGVLRSAQGDKEGALSDYSEAIRLQPEYAKAYNNRGNVRGDLGDRMGALSDYSEAIRLQPEYARAYYNRGNVRDDVGDREGALSDYSEAIRLQPEYAKANYNRGLLRSAQGDKEGALSDYSEAIRLQPDDAAAYNNRGVLRSAQGDKEGALSDYSEAIRLQPEYVAAYYNRGNVRDDVGDREGALLDYSEAIRLQPEYAEAYYNRGVLRSAQGDKEGALSDYSEAIRLQPDDAQAYYNRGNLRDDVGDREGALSDYSEAIRLHPEYAQAYYNRGVLRSAQGDKEGALSDYSEAIRLQPEYAKAYNNRGVLRSAQGDKEGALLDYSEAIRLQPDDAAAYYNRGNLRDDLGDREGALLDYSEAIRLQPEYAQAYYNRGITKIYSEDYAGALTDFDKVISLSPDTAKYYFLRGICHRSLGNEPAACADFKKALDLGFEEAREEYEQCGGH